MEQKKRRQRTYAVYDDDVFVDIGTKHELAERLGILANSITFMASPSYKKRKPNGRHAVFIGYDDDLEE
ncbi:hypothetical protein [Streptococcus dysgalactiae]|uniref:hypothetical protein n=1 Tax=Streptococcus dysgalactiae TaxID=1334 RepID=UPI003FD89245